VTAGPFGRWATVLLDLFFPRSCGACDRPLIPGATLEICDHCARQLPWMRGPYCIVCGDGPKPGRRLRIRSHGTCARCTRRRPVYAAARAAFRFEGVIRKAVHNFKFSGRRSLAGTLSELMIQGLRQDPEFLKGIHVVLSVPLHPDRLQERGFNQAHLIAAEIAAALDIPLKDSVLYREKPTRSQVGMDYRSRVINVQGAFNARKDGDLVGRTILLIDDVLTTGATANAAARPLLDAGAEEVRVAALARD
jgi:ComF family protein